MRSSVVGLSFDGRFGSSVLVSLVSYDEGRREMGFWGVGLSFNK